MDIRPLKQGSKLFLSEISNAIWDVRAPLFVAAIAAVTLTIDQIREILFLFAEQIDARGNAQIFFAGSLQIFLAGSNLKDLTPISYRFVKITILLIVHFMNYFSYRVLTRFLSRLRNLHILIIFIITYKYLFPSRTYQFLSPTFHSTFKIIFIFYKLYFIS